MKNEVTKPKYSWKGVSKIDTYRLHIPLKQYIKQKIKMLNNEFLIELTDEEETHFYSLKTESEVDIYASRIIATKL